MNKYEVKDILSSYYKACAEVSCIKIRLDKLMANRVPLTAIDNKIEEVNEMFEKAVLSADFSLAKCLDIINKLSNIDGDVTLLKKYHIDGLSEKAIAKQMHLSVEYIRKKRWRAYEKLSKII